MIHTQLTAQGIMTGVDISIATILKELEILDRKDENILNYDIHAISLLIFQRNLIKSKLAFCLNYVIEVMKSLMTYEDKGERKENEHCVIISEKIKELILTNDSKMEILALSTKQKSSVIH